MILNNSILQSFVPFVIVTNVVISIVLIIKYRNGIITYLKRKISKKVIPISVNYHFTRVCNYNCGFCFHTAKSQKKLDLEVAKQGLKMLKECGMKKN